jgi:hypothetical protein
MNRVFAILNSKDGRTLACSAALAWHVFILTGGTYSALDYPGGMLTDCYGINNLGQIVGDFEDSTLGLRGLLGTPSSRGGARKPHSIRLRSQLQFNSVVPTFGGQP